MPDDFQMLRASLAPQYATLGRDRLEAIVQEVYGAGASPEDVESLFGDIGRGLSHAAAGVSHFVQQAAPAVAQALPAMAQGAMAGSSLGPWGALAGAVAGGAGSILSHSSNPTARAIGGGIGTVTNLVSTVRGGGASGPLGALASVAGGTLGGPGRPNPLAPPPAAGGANALLGLLARPEALQALLAAALGNFGRPSVPVGGQDVPVPSMLSALGTLAQRAAHEMAEHMPESERVPEGLNRAGEALGLDTDDAEGRTDTLLTLLALTPTLLSASSARPVSVNVTAPEPAAPPAAPPLPPLGEAEWLSEADENYGIEDWESGGEAWPPYEAPQWREEEAFHG